MTAFRICGVYRGECMKHIIGVVYGVAALVILNGCQKTPEPVAPVPEAAEAVPTAPADAPATLDLDPGPGETIELGGEGTVELEGDSAPPTAEPTPGEGTPVP